MYERLDSIDPKFNNLHVYFDNPSGHDHSDLLCAALEATANQCLAAKSKTDLDRQNLGHLYHGFMAASRIVQRLHETRAAVVA